MLDDSRPHSRIIASLLTFGALQAATYAMGLSVPMTGWTATDSRGATWGDVAGACVLHEEQFAEAYPAFDTADAARTFAIKVQYSLLSQTEGGQKLSAVVTQPVDRAGKWTILVTYMFTQQDVQYRAIQLYLSDGGKLRTLTGSSAKGEASVCVNQMREFLRFLAN